MHSPCGALRHLQSRSCEELPQCRPDGFSIWAAIVQGTFWPLKTIFWCLNAILSLTLTALPHKAFFFFSRAFLSKLPHPLLCSGTFYVSYFSPMSHSCLLLLPLEFF